MVAPELEAVDGEDIEDADTEDEGMWTMIFWNSCEE